MLLSVESYEICRWLGEEVAFALLKKAGFDACDYSFYEGAKHLGEDYMDEARRTKEALDKAGLICNQAHAPYELREGETFDTSSENYLQIVRSLEYAAFLGEKNIVVHFIVTQDRENTYSVNQQYFKTLIPFCEKFGIRIAAENDFERRNGEKLPVLNDPDLLQQFVRDLQSDYVVACVDIGHAGMFNDPVAFLEKMDSSVLKMLHVHDNDLNEDLHMFPYTCNIKWDKVCAALAGIGYDGDLTFEVVKGIHKIPDELKIDAYVFLAKIGRHLIRKITKYKERV